MNNLKKTGGFTLVELIVVIAILGILAAVAVPAYSGYLEKANEAADIVQLDAIKTAVQGATAKYGAPTKITVTMSSKTVSTIKVEGVTGYSGNDISATYSGNDTEAKEIHSDFATFYTATKPTMKSKKFATTAIWNGTDWANS